MRKHLEDKKSRCFFLHSKLNVSYKALDAIVLTNAPKDRKKRQRFEAELFVSQNEEVGRVTPIQMHKARLLIGDEAANGLQKMLDKYDVSYVASSGQREQAKLSACFITAYAALIPAAAPRT